MNFLFIFITYFWFTCLMNFLFIFITSDLFSFLGHDEELD